MVKYIACILMLIFASGCQNDTIPDDLKNDIKDMKSILDKGDKKGLIKKYGWDYHEYVLSIGASDEVLNKMADKVDSNLVKYLDEILASKPHEHNNNDPESYEFRVDSEFVTDMPIYFMRYKGDDTWRVLFP